MALHVLRSLRALVCLLGIFTQVTMVGSAASRRDARVDDVLAAVSVDGMVFSPDGKALVFTRVRSILTEASAQQSSFRSRHARSDLWLQDGADRPVRDLTNGHADGTGAWAPQWAPDGVRLAFVSTRGGGGDSLWLWERKTNLTRRIPTPSIKTDWNGEACRWLDDARLLCTVSSKGDEVPAESYSGRYTRMTMAAWARAAKGELSADVLKSNEFDCDTQDLWVVDVSTGTGRKLVTTVVSVWPFRTWWLAPDGRTLAVVRPAASAYNFESGIRMGMPVMLELLSVESGQRILQSPLPENVHAATINWSADSREVAFFANGPEPVDPILLYGIAAAAAMPRERAGTRGNPARFYRVNIADRTITPWNTGDVDLGMMGAPEFSWTASGEIVVSAPRREYGWANGTLPSRGAPRGVTSSNAVPVHEPAANHWWVIARDGHSRQLSDSAATLPVSLRPINGGQAFVGVRDGDVWSIDPRTGDQTNLTAAFEPRVSRIASILQGGRSVRPQLLLMAELLRSTVTETTPVERDVYQLDVATRTLTRMESPAPAARIAAFAPVTRSTTYVADDLGGLFVWRTEPDRRRPALLLEENTYLREIAVPPCQTFSYGSLNGEALKARLCLPPDNVRGRHYPMVVNARYGRLVADDYEHSRIDEEHLLTSAGYAYLVPSIPARLPGTLPEEGDAPIMALNGLLPAVEKAVSLGSVDTQRVFLTGFSRGGWTVLAAIGLTTRFRAAVSGSQVDGGRINALDHSSAHRFGEAGEVSLVDPNGGALKTYRPSDVPWWRDGDMFRRNDPLTYVDRVQTPVMLLHGDCDAIAPLDDTEDYFFALASMRKPAELVRYWGEAHGSVIPANVRDGLQRQIAWFDRWGDISRDANGELIFEGDYVKSRHGAPPLRPEDFARVGPAAPSSVSHQSSKQD